MGQLKFSSGAFILLVGVTRLWVKVTCGKFNWMGMIWKGTHVLIKGPTDVNANRSNNQALGSKEQSVEVRNRFASSHISGEEFRKKICFIEGSQKHVVSVTLNGRSLKQPGFFLELASRPNWTTDGDGIWLEWWPRTWWSLYLSSMIICGDRRNLQKDKHHCNTPSIWALWQSSPQWRQKKNTLGIYKKALRAWAWTQSNISGETWKCASAPIQQSRQSLRGEEVRRRRIADNCQMLMSKACRIKQKRLEAVKVLQVLNI